VLDPISFNMRMNDLERGAKQSENIADETKPSEVTKTRANYEGSTKESYGICEENS